MITREEILQIVPGAMIVRCINGRESRPQRVTSIFAGPRENIKGRMFICGYTEFGENAQMSFSVSEGETFVRLA